MIHAFVRHVFADVAGEFGWQDHVVGVTGGAVVSVCAGYGGDTRWPFALAAARQILSHYGAWHVAGEIRRGLRVLSVIPPPSGAIH